MGWPEKPRVGQRQTANGKLYHGHTKEHTYIFQLDNCMDDQSKWFSRGRWWLSVKNTKSLEIYKICFFCDRVDFQPVMGGWIHACPQKNNTEQLSSIHLWGHAPINQPLSLLSNCCQDLLGPKLDQPRTLAGQSLQIGWPQQKPAQSSQAGHQGQNLCPFRAGGTQQTLICTGSRFGKTCRRIGFELNGSFYIPIMFPQELWKQIETFWTIIQLSQSIELCSTSFARI